MGHNTVTFKGTPLTLVGEKVNVGDPAPECVLLDRGLKGVPLSSFRGSVVILSTVPSLDTHVCDVETRRFNEEAVALGPEVVVVTVSMDLPFAQERWCAAAGIDNVVTLSDHKEGCVGERYGVLVKELRLLGRAVFVVDREGVIQYIQVVKELTEEPVYEPILEAVRSIL